MLYSRVLDASIDCVLKSQCHTFIGVCYLNSLIDSVFCYCLSLGTVIFNLALSYVDIDFCESPRSV